MIDSALLLDELLKRALEQSNQNVLNRLKNEDFIKSLDDVTEVLSSLGMYINHDDGAKNDIYLKIANALVRSFFTTYYINLNTGLYVGYSSNKNYKTLKIEEKGNDFFKDVKKNIPKTVYHDDQERLLKVFNKDFLIKETNNGNVFKTRYRLLLNNIPTYISLSAIRITDDDLIIGLNNVDEITKKEMEYKNTIKESLTYNKIALALSVNFFGIYYVNTKTDEYEQYNIDSHTQLIEKISEGKDFFYDSTVNAKKLIHPEDLDKFLSAINKKNMLNELKTNNSFYFVYRQFIDGVPTYLQLKVVNLLSDSNHIVLAISNIDKQVRKENEYNQKYEKERMFARTDGLTGCYNKNYLLEIAEDINNKINEKFLHNFAIAVCDINDLKKINDTLGHDIGDKYIIEAKNILEKTFNNSPIFRTGGDEFVIILYEKDYRNRLKLIKKIEDSNLKNKKTNNVVIACGYSDFVFDKDTSIEEVMKRADEAMYENKKQLKK
ncbi:MAG: GGDEF domain-containing protein [Acholeplasmatales bacterium]|nr:GGDEF domain-containing protein [Acholeplasmatales bacterium]